MRDSCLIPNVARGRVTALVVGLLLCGSMVAPTDARADIGEPRDGVAQRTLTAGVYVTVRGDDLVVKVGDQQETVLEPDVSARNVTGPAPVPTTPEDEVGVCLTSKSTVDDKNRVAYAPVPVAAAGDVGHIQYIFHLYRLEKARRVMGKPQRQYETCSRGLGQSDADNWRMQVAGAAQADTNPTKTTRIGWSYRSGATPPSYALTYGFARGSNVCGGAPAAKACSDSSISGSIAQTASGQLLGGFKAPMGQGQYLWENNVAGWWDGEDVEGEKAYRSHGTVIHSLWEYDETDPVGTQPGHYFEVYAYFTCSRWFGFGCGVPEPPTAETRL